MLANGPQKFRVRVLRPCLIQGQRSEAGEEHALSHSDAINAVISGRCEEVDKLPKIDLSAPAMQRY